MSSALKGPRVLKGAFVSVADGGGMNVLPFQYNPSSMQRSLHPQMVGGEEQDRSMAVKFKGAPTQTIDVTIELDASTGLDNGETDEEENGVYSQLSAFELLASPISSVISSMQTKLSSGVMEVAPMAAPNLYFVWGPNRVLPVRLTQYTITEELFDGALSPIRVSVAISMRVLNYSDLDASNQGYHQYLVYQQTMEKLAANAYGNINVTGSHLG
jgi:hypothetical protein